MSGACLNGSIPSQMSSLVNLRLLYVFFMQPNAATSAGGISWQNRDLSGNKAVTGTISKQLSALSLLTYMYAPSYCIACCTEKSTVGINLLLSLQCCQRVGNAQELGADGVEQPDSSTAITPQETSSAVRFLLLLLLRAATAATAPAPLAARRSCVK